MYMGTTSTAPNVPSMVSQGITGMRQWQYDSTHVSSDISEANFFTDGEKLGLKVGDIVIHNGAANVITSHSVLVVSATGTDLGVGTTIGLGA